MMEIQTLEYNIRKLVCNLNLDNTDIVEFLHITLTYMFADSIVNCGRILVMKLFVMILCQEYPSNSKRLQKVENYFLQNPLKNVY